MEVHRKRIQYLTDETFDKDRFSVLEIIDTVEDEDSMSAFTISDGLSKIYGIIGTEKNKVYLHNTTTLVVIYLLGLPFSEFIIADSPLIDLDDLDEKLSELRRIGFI